MPRFPLVVMLGLAAASGCSEEAAKPPDAIAPAARPGFAAEGRPRHRALIAIYNGPPGDATSCSHLNDQRDGLIYGDGKLTCGYAGKVSELSWSFSGRRGDQDIYLFTRKYPSDAPNAALTSREAAFSGERIILFQDANQTILMDPPAP